MAGTTAARPPFLVSTSDVPPSGESASGDIVRAIGRHAGLLKIELQVVELPPGARTSPPRAESNLEEFALVLAGQLDAWIDGDLHTLRAGDLLALPSGTGISHTLLNNSAVAAEVLLGGQRRTRELRTVYPRNPELRAGMVWNAWWDDAPKRVHGPHDGLTDLQRGRPARTPSALSKVRPPFILTVTDQPEVLDGHYPDSDELLSPSRSVGAPAGLQRIGLHVERVTRGTRTSWPHAESAEEEFVFVLAGNVDVWVDGHIYTLSVGDLAAFPAGTGISHGLLGNHEGDATVLVGGEASRPDNRVFYPLHPQRRAQLPWSSWWSDVPARPLGPHPGMPDLICNCET